MNVPSFVNIFLFMVQEGQRGNPPQRSMVDGGRLVDFEL
jgi:hypothetical protein